MDNNFQNILFVGSFPREYIATQLANKTVQYISVADAKARTADFFTKLAEAEVIVSRSGCLFSADVLAKAPHLRLLIKAGAGIDQVDAEYCKNHRITVANTPGANAVSVAELTIGLMISLSRHIVRVHKALEQGEWLKNDPVGEEVYGKKAVIVGYGYVGRRTAALLRALGVETTVYDPSLTAEEQDAARLSGCAIKYNFNDAIANQDFIILHTSYNPSSHEIINSNNLHRLKPGVKIINVARGQVLEHAAMVTGLDQGIIGGLAIDAWWKEPPGHNEFIGRPNVVLTPHIGANTKESLLRTTSRTIELIHNQETVWRKK